MSQIKPKAMLMSARHPLEEIKTFPSLVKYLRDELDWPIEQEDFEDLTFDFEPDELGLDAKTAANINKIKQLRPLVTNQPWGIFFVSFEPKRLPVVALRKILGKLVIKKRASANKSERAAWDLHDLLFVSAFGEGDDRQMTLAHFSEGANGHDIPTLKVLGWDELDTQLNLQHVDHQLHERLRWPEKPDDLEAWRKQWSAAFTLRNRQVITTAQDLAERLAVLARSIRAKVKQVLEIESERGQLRKLYAAFREALIHDLDEDDFADMYAQTITYGLFSAAVSRTTPDAGTIVLPENLADMVPITNPFLREMLSTFLSVGGRKGKLDFDELGIQEVVELLNSPDTNLNAVVRNFGDRRPGEDPVIHFYEDFLKQYDRKRRVERGVFYTPQPVVSYIVRSVHELLQTEFGLEEGLASTATWGEMLARHPETKLPTITIYDDKTRQDVEKDIDPATPFVQILDPATGTATFLVEVIDVIYRAMTEKWNRQGLNREQQRTEWNEYVPKGLLPRLHGFELMMAPYAIAHMKIGLKLGETGYRFHSDERARVYLTNSLEPPAPEIQQRRIAEMSEALAHEAQAVNEIKRHQRFTVVIGNPPYSINSCNLHESAVALIEPFRYVDGDKIQERGALKFETILQDDYMKFVGLGLRILQRVPSGIIGLISNNGFLTNRVLRGVRKALLDNFNQLTFLNLHGNRSKHEVCPDGSPDENVFDINQGVGISILCKRADRPRSNRLELADLWGSRDFKYRTLERTTASQTTFQDHAPRPPYYAFTVVDGDIDDEYRVFEAIDEAMPFNKAGFVSGRDAFAVDFDFEPLEKRIGDFLNPKNSDSTVRERYSIKDAGGYELTRRRQPALLAKLKAKDIIHRVQHRPFDYRFVAYSEAVLTSPQKAAMQQLIGGKNLAFCLSRGAEIVRGWEHVFCTRAIMQHHTVSLKEVNYVFPLRLNSEKGLLTLGAANFSARFLKALASHMGLGIDCESRLPAGLTAEDIFHFAYAVLHSRGYRSRYADFLKIDFPRLPLTAVPDLFRALGRIGGELVALHLLESTKLDQYITRFVGAATPIVGRVAWSHETVWIDAPPTRKGAGQQPGTIGFIGVRDAVWNFHIGGYQICEKWLKDRKGRTLSRDDIDHYHKIVIALSETVRLMTEIDQVIDQHGGWPGAFVTDAPPPDCSPQRELPFA